MRLPQRGWIVLALAAGLAALPAPAAAWGFAGHRMVNRKAARTLPRPLRELFVGNLNYLAERSIDPDLQRSGPADPDHFLDMDAFGAYPFAEIPKDEKLHLAKFGEAAREKGRVPWKVAEAYRDLVEAFRKGEAPLVLARAGSLAHYIADAHVPLHAALNHDGQLTGQRGLHGRWESALFERNERDLEASVLPGAAAPIGNPVDLTFEALRSSYLHSIEVLASDKACAGTRDLPETPDDDRYDDAYYSRMYEREASRLRARLSSSASAVGSLWLSAWNEAGSPTLDASYRVPYLRHRERAVLISIDGSAAPLLDDAVSRGVMPHLATLRKRGATASDALSTLPAKTAAGHAALYTGTWSDVNGIADNDVAVPGGAIDDSGDGFSALYLRAEPLWAAAARQDVGVAVVSATQVSPFSRYFDPQLRFPGWYSDKLTLFDGYQGVETSDRVYSAADLGARPPGEWLAALPRHGGEVREVSITDLGVTIDGLLYDDPDDPVAGFDTLYLGLDRDPRTGVTLKPQAVRGDASAFAGLAIPLAGTDAGLFFRLFALSPDGSEVLLYRSAAHVLRSNKGRLDAPAFEATGGFLGNGASRPYRAGRLGRTIPEGGDGTAEKRYLETMALVIRQIGRLEEFVHSRTAWELLFTYLPYPDEALHEWYGYIDPNLAGRDSAIGDRLRPYLDEVLRQVDAHLGRLVTRVGPEVTVAVAGDHGIMGVNRIVSPNVAFARAGLLSVDAAGTVDLAHTRVIYGPGNFVLINRAARPGGIVTPEEEPALRRQVTDVLRPLKDPDTGRAVILDVLDPRTTTGEPRFGGPGGGDIYLVPAAGYLVGKGLKGEPVGPLRPRGEHLLDPKPRSMRPGFAIAGPGIASGVSLGSIRQIDIAPTLAILLGLEPPAQSSGAVLESALARKAPRPPVR